jgi:hypothetical protein
VSRSGEFQVSVNTGRAGGYLARNDRPDKTIPHFPGGHVRVREGPRHGPRPGASTHARSPTCPVRWRRPSSMIRRPRAAHSGLLRHARRAYPPPGQPAAGVTASDPGARPPAILSPPPGARPPTFCPPLGPAARPAGPDANPPHAPRHITPGTNEGMNAASGLPVACPAGRPAMGRRQLHKT